MDRFTLDFYKDSDGNKPVEKTPKREIELAEKRRLDYFRRKEENTYE